jgi:hypothetical protein
MKFKVSKCSKSENGGFVVSLVRKVKAGITEDNGVEVMMPSHQLLYCIKLVSPQEVDAKLKLTKSKYDFVEKEYEGKNKEGEPQMKKCIWMYPRGDK